MSNVDFQNGFICGMATKGLVRSGEYYQPNIYNDPGIFNYFYIDFRRTLMPFSLGMWNESVVVHDSLQLDVTKVEQAWTQNPYSTIVDDIAMSVGTLTDTVCTNGVLTLGAVDNG